MITDKWPSWFRDLYGGSWPVTYCAFDIETTGLKMDDYVVEVGHCLVEDGVVTSRTAVALNWMKGPAHVRDDFVRRLETTKRVMMKDGKPYRFDLDYLAARGIDPIEGLSFFHDFLVALRDRGVLFVAHNGHKFDEPVLAASFARFGICPAFSLGDRFFDTSAIEKASQISFDTQALPRQGDTLRSYFIRVAGIRAKGVLSNLGSHCVVKYGLCSDKELLAGKLHTAAFDAYLVHLLMGKFSPSALCAERSILCAAGPIRQRGQRNS